MPAHTHTRGTMEITGGTAAVGGSEFKFGPLTGAFYNNTKCGYYGKTTDTSHPDRYDGFNFAASRAWTGETSQSGLNTTATIMPPYLVVYVWKRTA